MARQLSVPEETAATALKKVLNEVKATEKALEEAQNHLLEYEAKELVANSVNNIVACTFENRTVQTLQKLGRAVVSQHSELICLFVANNEDKLNLLQPAELM